MDQQRSRWDEITGGDHGARYAARFADLAESGADVHGEARFCAARLAPGSRVLDAGCGTGRVAAKLVDEGHTCVGVDSDASMLAEARRARPDIDWYEADLVNVTGLDVGAFDMVIAAGNVVPLLAEGTESTVITGLAELLRPGGVLVSGFGLDTQHLPLSFAPTTLDEYDTWCSRAGLVLRQRFATWDADPYEGGGYAVSVHTRP
ncbi:ubiquinone/menaquinone biosynthesis C-methylase UbiE [Haloactinospora alba]|uniref:Ubiquinone/menaquinone biosynthesis C-methylase UbiE n=1 Tax=Haloactinospora alba TaxID=405555 RepID=A0A543NIF6_9ACTN|nr:ubiquinone/menaquinone biosynthesis C-methylase UbiE [Haloactinospora alba]